MNALNPLAPDKSGADRKTYEPSMEEILASIRRIIADDQAFAVRQTAPPEAVAAPHAGAASVPEAMPLRGRIVPKEEVSKAKVTPETAAPRSAIEPRVPSAMAWRPSAPLASVPPASVRPASVPSASVRPASVPDSIAPDSSVPDSSAPPTSAAFSVEARFPFFKAAAVPPVVAAIPPEKERIDPAGARSNSVDAAKEILRPSPPEWVIAPQPVQTPAQAADESAAEALPLVSPATDASVSSSFNALIASQFLQSGEGLKDMVREMIRPMLKAWLDDNLPVLVERLVRAEIERVARGSR